MAEARVESTDAIKEIRTALVKFAEAANSALADADSDGNRTLNWLQGEAKAYWRQQQRVRQEALAKAKEALRMKQLYKDPTGRAHSVIDEQKAVTAAARKLEEAVAKSAAVQRMAGLTSKQMVMYKGSIGRLQGTLQSEIPAAVARLGVLIERIERYTLASTSPVSDAAFAEAAASMARAGIEHEPADAEPQAVDDQGAPIPPGRSFADRVATARGRAGRIVAEVDAPPAERAETAFALSPADRVRLEMLSSRYDSGKGIVGVWSELATYEMGMALCRVTSIDGPAIAVVPLGSAGSPAQIVRHAPASFFSANAGYGCAARLPEGFVVIIDRSGIVSAVDPLERDRWPGILGGQE